MYTKRANVRRIWECVSCVLVVGVGGGGGGSNEKMQT